MGTPYSKFRFRFFPPLILPPQHFLLLPPLDRSAVPALRVAPNTTLGDVLLQQLLDFRVVCPKDNTTRGSRGRGDAPGTGWHTIASWWPFPSLSDQLAYGDPKFARKKMTVPKCCPGFFWIYARCCRTVFKITFVSNQ